MRNTTWLLASLCLAVLMFSIARAQVAPQAPSAANQSAQGWQIPETARDEKSPLTPTADVLKKGKAIYSTQCQKCHGPEGKGDGPDGDPEHRPGDLTDASRASRNPDGVMFYKAWNGRKEPKMPAFKSSLTKDEVWRVVEYAKSLRKP